MIKFATIGSGSIVHTFLKEALLCEELEYVAVYSRKEPTGKEFAAQYGVSKVYTDLNELAEDGEIDAVYIASPNCFHCEQAILLMEHQKHILCEKSIASNVKEAENMKTAAEANGVVLLEAVRSIFDFGFSVILATLPELGKIRRISLQYGKYSSRYDNYKNGMIENAFNPMFSNGALMDIGVYVVHALIRLAGMPKEIIADAILLDNGIDGQGTILAKYDGMQAELLYTKIANNCIPSQIQGEEATLVIDDISCPYRFRIYKRSGEVKETQLHEPGWNMIYEIKEWIRLIQNKEVIHRNNEYSVMAMQIMDEARKQTGIVFPADTQ